VTGRIKKGRKAKKERRKKRGRRQAAPTDKVDFSSSEVSSRPLSCEPTGKEKYE
jgi:hypothetical protein